MWIGMFGMTITYLLYRNGMNSWIAEKSFEYNWMHYVALPPLNGAGKYSNIELNYKLLFLYERTVRTLQKWRSAGVEFSQQLMMTRMKVPPVLYTYVISSQI